MTPTQLKERLRTLRDDMEQDHAVRLHRAVSWLLCAERYREDDQDVAFMALWVSFNACYGSDAGGELRLSEAAQFRRFTQRLCALDSGQRIHALLWLHYSQFVRVLIDNHWVYGPFWDSVRAGDEAWREPFERSRRDAFKALANNDTPRLLRIILKRLYVLRNQLLHGGATYQSSLNRDQVRDGVRLLAEFMPVCIELMFAPGDWGPVPYPVVEVDGGK